MKPYNFTRRLGFRRRFIHYFLLNIARMLFLAIPYEVHGKENLPPEGKGTLLVSNHLSHIDSVFTAVAAFPAKRAIHFSGAKNFMEKWWLRWTKYELAFPVGRGDKERIKFIRTCITLLKDKTSVGIYPEGKRSRSGKFNARELKVGAGWIAKLAGSEIDVIPVYVHGTNKIIPVGKFFRLNFNAKLKICFGPPIDLSNFYSLPKTAETSKKIVEKIGKAIKKQEKMCFQKISANQFDS